MPVEYVKKGHVAIITMNRPEARNAINGEMAATMEAALDQMEADPEVWVGILTAVGKAFCAGADLKEISAGNGGALSTKKGGFAGIARRERTKPLIAAITGSALAGGTEIALSCDMIIAADDTNFGLPEVKRSLVAGAGGLFRLPRQIGKAVALEAILTGDPLSSQRAYELGMVNKVVPEAEVMMEAEKLAARITANAPLAVAASRAVAISATAKTDEELWKDSGVAFASIINTEDYKEGPKAFIEKRAPVWKGK
ncbi:MAG: enoyl-CoA hydratase [Hyphomonas sp.]|uniref:crotonase/enoyl-CoA hydratase family protein n=1 Tax=Hyphomonas sp. TaxID=87 RepID=UPI001DEFF238|nr:crotonase/enoyl-CoA hydratase family protein [Hyphomonas sp.]MBA4227603.1 enoyl-CoA hydratase [Hyphomonas sp.]